MKIDWKWLAVGFVAGVVVRHFVPALSFPGHVVDPDYSGTYNPGHVASLRHPGLREGWELTGNPHYNPTLA